MNKEKANQGLQKQQRLVLFIETQQFHVYVSIYRIEGTVIAIDAHYTRYDKKSDVELQKVRCSEKFKAVLRFSEQKKKFNLDS